MSRVYRKHIVVFTLLLSLLLFACSDTQERIVFDKLSLAPGLTMLLSSTHTDSIVGPQHREERKKTEKAIQYTVLDTVNGATIEWTEHFLIAGPDSSNAYGEAFEWVFMYRIVFHCDSHGHIDKVLNFPEIRDSFSSMVNSYIELADLANDPRIEDILSASLDSSLLMTRLLSDAELFHRQYQVITLLEDTTEVMMFNPYSEPAIVPVTVARRSDPLCLGTIGIHLWSTPVDVDLNKMATTHFPIFTESIGSDIPLGQVSEETKACFDNHRSVTTYLDQKQTIRMDTTTMIRRVVLFEQE